MITPATGSTSFCLDRFSEGAGIDFRGRSGPRSVKKVRRQVCRLLGIGSSAGYRWFAFGIMPNGVRLIRLRYLLEFVGYTIEETQDLTPEQRMLANHLALSVNTADYVSGVMKVSSDTVMNWAMGRFTPNDDHTLGIKGCLKDFAKNAQKESRRWRETLRSLDLISESKIRRKEQPVATSAIEGTPPDALCDEGDRVMVHVGAATGMMG